MFWRTALALLALIEVHGQHTKEPSSDANYSSPHLILWVLDDIGWSDVGYHGSTFPTPNIDELALSGVELDRMYVMPQCSPTRSAVMTGRFAFRTGMQHFTTLMPGSSAGLPKDSPTIAEQLRKTHDTHMIGKWHLGNSDWKQTPTGRGFNSYTGYMQGQTDYYNRTVASCVIGGVCLFPANKNAKSPFGPNANAYDFWNNSKATTQDFGKYTLDSYMERAEQILAPYGSASPPEKPLFLYFAEQHLHIPIESPPYSRHLQRCQKRGVKGGSTVVNRTVLCAMASMLDESMGEFVAKLKAYGMWDNTLIWVLSDNGGMTHWSENFPASASSNYPLRGGKTTLFEGGMRSVSLMNGGVVPPWARGTKVTKLLHAVDVLPTFLGRARSGAGRVPADVDGLDAWRVITGGATQDNVTAAMKRNDFEVDRGEGGAGDGRQAEGWRTELPLQIAINPMQVTGKFPHVPQPTDGSINYTALIVWPYKILIGDSYIRAGGMAGDRDGYWHPDGNYTYTPPPPECRNASVLRLFNIELDEGETTNLAFEPSQSERVRNMTRRVREVWASKSHGYVEPQTNIPHPRANPRLHSWIWAPWRALSGGDEEAVRAEELEAGTALLQRQQQASTEDGGGGLDMLGLAL